MGKIAHFWPPEWLIQSSPPPYRRSPPPTRQSMQRPNEQQQRLSSWAINYVQAQWEKTGIPHSLDGQAGDKKSGKADPKMQKNAKKTVEDRDKKFGQEFDSLFDVASCQDKNPESCNCPAGLKVPPNWVAFLQDQRSSRLHTNTLLSDRAQSLRGGIRDLTFEEKKEHQRALEKFEEKIQRKRRMVERKRKSDQDVDHLFRTESLLFLLFRS